MGYGREVASFSDLKGRTVTAIDGCSVGSEEITFSCSDGSRWRLFHWHDCCESVTVNEVVGDVRDIVGRELADAEESENEGTEDHWGHQTWTFYRLRTMEGSLMIRWLGESNGYYSESVDFERVEDEPERADPL